MASINRRTFAQITAGTVAGVASGMRLPGAMAAQDDIAIQWWDHYAPLEQLLTAQFDAYGEAHAGVSVERTLYNLPELGQSLQLAFNSDQAPDVHAIASLNIPVARLHAEGWFAPLEDYVSAEFKGRFPEGILLEGLHSFGGKLYSFPMFSFRSTSTAVWYNKSLLEDAGVNPDTDLATWDGFRTAAKTITDKGGGTSYGWIQAIQLADRLGAQVSELAQLAGAAGAVDYLTGEYSFHTQPFLDAIEFLLSMHHDGSLFPASTSLDARNARARFCTGVAGLNLDGPWTMGVINNDYPEFLESIGVAQTPLPNGATDGFVSRGPNGGDFWISSQSDHPEVGAGILEQFNLPEFYVGLAERMDQPPLDISSLDTANVHDAYRQSLTNFDAIVRLAPVPEVRNPAVVEVLSRMTDIRPNFGEIVQGIFSGDVDDHATRLKEYSDTLTAEREKAIGEATAAGAKVSVDDWVFPNWERGTDYTADFYK